MSEFSRSSLGTTVALIVAASACRYSPVLNMVAGCVHYGDKQHVGSRFALALRSAVYGHDVVAVGPMVVGVVVNATAVVVDFSPDGGSIEVRNTSGFELSLNGEDYTGALIVAHTDLSVTLSVPAVMRNRMPDARGAVVSMRCVGGRVRRACVRACGNFCGSGLA